MAHVKRLCLLLSLILLPLLAIGQVTFSDNFNRADGALGADWTIYHAGNPQLVDTDGFLVSGNKAVYSGAFSGGAEYATHGGLCNDQVVTATIADTGSFHEIHARGAMGGAVDAVLGKPNAIECIVDARHHGDGGVDTVSIDYEYTGGSIGFTDWTTYTWALGRTDLVNFPPALNQVQVGDIVKLTVAGASVSCSITRGGVEYVMGTGTMSTVDGILSYPTGGTAGFMGFITGESFDNFSVVSTGGGCGGVATAEEPVIFVTT